jgi:hypothetical protein
MWNKHLKGLRSLLGEIEKKQIWNQSPESLIGEIKEPDWPQSSKALQCEEDIRETIHGPKTQKSTSCRGNREMQFSKMNTIKYCMHYDRYLNSVQLVLSVKEEVTLKCAEISI